MRLKASPLPNPGDPHMTDSKLLCQLARASVRGTIRRFPLCSGQDLRFQLRRILRWRTTGMPRVQSRQPTILKTLLPSRDVTAIATQCGLNGGERLTIGQHQNQSVSYTHLRAHETGRNLVCRLLLEKK